MGISIAVLDANNRQRNDTLELLDGYAARRHLDADVSGFKSWNSLIRALEQRVHYDIYILETELPEISGFFAAREIRSRNKHSKIIYYTENKQAAVQAFEVSADNYLIKPASRERFDKTMDRIIADIESVQRSEVIAIKVHGGYVHLNTDEIAYVNIVHRALCYHMRDGSTVRGLVMRGTFRNAVSNLTVLPMFRMVGASLLVNLDLVRVMSRTSILFNHGEWIMPPRDAFTSLYRAWSEKKPNLPYS